MKYLAYRVHTECVYYLLVTIRMAIVGNQYITCSTVDGINLYKSGHAVM